MPRPVGLRGSLDHDIYQVVKRLEETTNDGKPFKTVPAAYDAIKHSNSSLSRQKKRPLEDALARVLPVRRREHTADASDESDSALINSNDPALPQQNDLSLINTQMTKHWNIKPVMSLRNINGKQPATKKRKFDGPADADTDDKNTTGAAGAATTASTPKELTTDAGKTQKKTQRPTRFEVEDDDDTPELGGLGELYDNLYLMLNDNLVNPGYYRANGFTLKEGLLLTGPPGVGKRSLVRLLASKLEVVVINATGCFDEPERLEKSLTEAFDAAFATAPAIVLIESLEECMPKPGSASHNEQHQRAVRILCQQMRRIQALDAPPVMAVATASRPMDINVSLLRHTLFRKTVQVRVPDATAREDILRVVTRSVSIGADVDFAQLARLTHGFVAEDLHALISEAGDLTARRHKTTAELTAWRDSSNLDAMEPLHDLDEVGPPEHTPITFDTFKAVLRDFIPSLRKEGFTVIPNVNWEHVGGLASVRQQLELSVVGPIRDPALYQTYGLSRPAGCLLWGPPGCGKTLVAQAVANEAQASFILISGPELLNKYVGESERAVRELFQRARSSTPCILFFDEFDSIVPRRDGAATEAGTRVVNALLAELDGVQDRTGIYVIGTTNRPDMIDEAILRPGRLSVQLFLDLPSTEERVEILRAIYKKNHVGATEADLAPLADVARDQRCADFSGADLGGLRTKAAEGALRRHLRLRLAGEEPSQPGRITAEDWEAALATTTTSVRNPEAYRKLSKKIGKGT